MKHMAVMAALVLARLKQEGVTPKRDLIFAGVADEEAGCDHGSRWLVDHHPDLVRAEYALGEVGGFSVRMSGRVIYPIMVAEKGTVWMKLRATGRPGHGSMPRENNAVARIGAAVAKLAATRLPQHRTQVVDRYLRAIAKTQPFPNSALLPRLHNPRIASFVCAGCPTRAWPRPWRRRCRTPRCRRCCAPAARPTSSPASPRRGSTAARCPVRPRPI